MKLVVENLEQLYESNSEIKKIQRELWNVEHWFESNKYNEKTWGDKEEQAKLLRLKLFALTGDYYGETKIDRDKKNIKPQGLNKSYNSPEDVPVSVYKWILANTSLLNTDATDAVRFSRIINTANDDRYPQGMMTIYRAVDNPEYDEIRSGDWVTTDIKYAENHLRMYFDSGKIISADVDGKDVLISPTGDTEEAIYAPLEDSINIKL